MENTPLYDALTSFAAQNPLRMHMPGHKGKPLLGLDNLAAIDFTELPPTGNLFDGGGAIGEAEELWAEVFHMDSCLFLTGGSTQGVLAALTLACNPGDTVLLDRGSHRSAYNALALLDLKPVYLDRPWLDQAGVTGPISPERVEELLESNPEIKALCLTSPTYYGVLSDLPALAEVMHRRGGVLVVDGAHGAHLPFLGDYGLNAADLLVVSAHKTLPAPGQTALLFSNGTFSHADLRRAGSIYGSSSPSYAMMAALDLCRAHMLEGGADAYRKTAEEVDRLRNTFPALTEEVAPLDPTRLVVCAPDGYAAQDALEGRNVWPEMADGGHVVFIPTCADSPEDFTRLEEALRQVDLGPCPGYPAPPEPPEMVLTPRQALFAPRKSLPLEQAEGQVAACQVAPYPPGVPVIAPGERVDKKSIAYLKQIGYNTLEDVSVAVL
ncbi:aminotransferase class I/II-fold pyridoxal phosphate-dependent enzyme [Flavonifractor sp. An112]|uniref:aminotransferase class I/II-fold pyridoxal phosphate-dependent enzyme n=1 Tax=Flavonifractor sp. An112 TaxID=1965544 RepID=UPI00174A7696|nr:aminotransferase class V-fold PLP-dependent enzyme [Flavonifractor sp. An112]HIZ94756.1 aminotransferase class V-fold PLP-dependent enzyme [Candidatus Flavonifractor avicola]